MGYLDLIQRPEDIRSLDIEQLYALAQEIRDELVRVVELNGGHLASNLGVVELTIALLYVYNPPRDKLLFDVGHQTYVYKLLTGRADRFETIRQPGGLSGFPDPEESPYDAYVTGHASTAASIGLGMAQAQALKNHNDHVVCVIGDAALTGGMAFEALNDIGQAQRDMLIILNDNHMSIDRNVGAVARHLARMRASNRYVSAKIAVRDRLQTMPLLGKGIRKILDVTKRTLRRFLVPNRLFEAMGFHYLGPFDGHDLKEMVDVLKSSKDLGRPVLLHVVTRKGKGYEAAEKQPEKYHGVAPYLVEKDLPTVSMSRSFGAYLTRIAEKNHSLVAITAAMTEGTGLAAFSKAYPQRFFDVGIAEQHAAGLAAGLAAGGMRPFLCLYSTFLQRAYDQVFQDICLAKQPVTIMIDRAGFVGEDGKTHQGLYDIGLLRNLPHIKIFAPSGVLELQRMMDRALLEEGPVAIRYAKDGVQGSDPGVLSGYAWERQGEGDIAILSYGRMLENAKAAQSLLLEQGIAAQVVNARFLRPIDEKMLGDLLTQCRQLCIVEEHMPEGGLASIVAEYAQRHPGKAKVQVIAAESASFAHADVQTQWRLSGMLPGQIAEAVRRQL